MQRTIINDLLPWGYAWFNTTYENMHTRVACPYTATAEGLPHLPDQGSDSALRTLSHPFTRGPFRSCCAHTGNKSYSVDNRAMIHRTMLMRGEALSQYATKRQEIMDTILRLNLSWQNAAPFTMLLSPLLLCATNITLTCWLSSRQPTQRQTTDAL